MDFGSDEFRNKHIKNLLIWLQEEVLSAGGDGDAFWISEYYSIEELLPIVTELNNSLWNNWWTIKSNKSSISLYNQQESMLITTNKDYDVPLWAQCVIIY